MAQIDAKTSETVDQEIKEVMKVHFDESQEEPEIDKTNTPPVEDSTSEDSAQEFQNNDDGDNADKKANVGDEEINDNDNSQDDIPDYEALLLVEREAREKAEKRTRDAQGEMTKATQDRAESGKRLGELEGILPEYQRLRKEEEERQLNQSRTPLPIDDIRSEFGDELADSFNQLQNRSDALEKNNRQLVNIIEDLKTDNDAETANTVIKTAHNDAFDIVFGDGRKAFDDWKAQLNSFSKKAVDFAISGGSPQDVIDVISSYKDSKNTTSNNQGSDTESQRRLELARKSSTPNATSTRVPTKPRARAGGIEAVKKKWQEWQKTNYRPSNKEIAELEQMEQNAY